MSHKSPYRHLRRRTSILSPICGTEIMVCFVPVGWMPGRSSITVTHLSFDSCAKRVPSLSPFPTLLHRNPEDYIHSLPFNSFHLVVPWFAYRFYLYPYTVHSWFAYIHPYTHPFLHPSIHPSLPSPIHLSILPYTPCHFSNKSIHQYIHSSIHPFFIHSSVHPSIQPSIFSFSQIHNEPGKPWET